MQILVVYLSFKVVLCWSCTGVVILYFNAFACICWLCGWVVGSFRPGSVRRRRAEVRPEAGAGGIVRSFRPGSVRRRRAEVRPEAGDVRLVGRAGVLGLTARCVGLVRWKRSASPKPSPLRGSADGWSGWSFCAWLVRVGKCVGRGQAQKPSHCGTACN